MLSLIHIIDLQLADLHNNLTKIGLSVSIPKKAKLFLAKEGFSSEYGARHLRRTIQTAIEDPLSELLLSKTFDKCSRIKIDVKSGKFEFLPIPQKKQKKSEKSS